MFMTDLRQDAAEALRRGDVASAISLLQRLIDAPNTDIERGELLSELATAQIRGNALDDALANLNTALDIATRMRSGPLQTRCLFGLGELYARQKDHRMAMRYYQQAMPLTRTNNDRNGTMRALAAIGDTYANMNKPAQAIEYHYQALQLAISAAHTDGQKRALSSLGNLYSLLERWDRAQDFYQQALDLATRTADLQGESVCLGNMAMLYAATNRPTIALDYLMKAVTLARRVGDVVGEANRLGSIGMVYTTIRDYPNAIRHFEDAYALFTELDMSAPAAAMQNRILALRAQYSEE